MIAKVLREARVFRLNMMSDSVEILDTMFKSEAVAVMLISNILRISVQVITQRRCRNNFYTCGTESMRDIPI